MVEPRVIKKLISYKLKYESDEKKILEMDQICMDELGYELYDNDLNQDLLTMRVSGLSELVYLLRQGSMLLYESTLR